MMPTFVAIHKWKKEDFKTVAKKIIEAKLPNDAKLCSTYVKKDMIGGWCVWEAASEKPILNFVKTIPEMGTEVVEAGQWFPPSFDLYGIIHALIS
jgi:hypothetical protein